jgi:hypothetical protein
MWGRAGFDFGVDARRRNGNAKGPQWRAIAPRDFAQRANAAAEFFFGSGDACVADKVQLSAQGLRIDQRFVSKARAFGCGEIVIKSRGIERRQQRLASGKSVHRRAPSFLDRIAQCLAADCAGNRFYLAVAHHEERCCLVDPVADERHQRAHLFPQICRQRGRGQPGERRARAIIPAIAHQIVQADQRVEQVGQAARRN